MKVLVSPTLRIRMQLFCWSKWAPCALWLSLPSSSLLHPLFTMCKAVQPQGCMPGEGLLWKLTQAPYRSDLRESCIQLGFPTAPSSQSVSHISQAPPPQLYKPRHLWARIRPGAPSSHSWGPKKRIQASMRKQKKRVEYIYENVCVWKREKEKKGESDKMKEQIFALHLMWFKSNRCLSSRTISKHNYAFLFHLVAGMKDAWLTSLWWWMLN